MLDSSSRFPRSQASRCRSLSGLDFCSLITQTPSPSSHRLPPTFRRLLSCTIIIIAPLRTITVVGEEMSFPMTQLGGRGTSRVSYCEACLVLGVSSMGPANPPQPSTTAKATKPKLNTIACVVLPGMNTTNAANASKKYGIPSSFHHSLSSLSKAPRLTHYLSPPVTASLWPRRWRRRSPAVGRRKIPWAENGTIQHASVGLYLPREQR